MLRAALLAAPLLAMAHFAVGDSSFAPGDSQADSSVDAAAFASLLEGWPNEPTRYPQGCVNSARYPLDSFVYATRVLGSVTVRITGGAGRRPTDILVLGACDGAIRVTGSGSQSLLIAASGIVAGASAGAFTACLRAIRFQSTAPIGEEGLGPRTITYHAVTPDNRFEDTDEKIVEVVPANPQNCPQQFTPLLEGMLGRTTYIEGCVNDVNYPVDSGVRATRPLFEVSVYFTSGQRPTDALRFADCPLRVYGSFTQRLTIQAWGPEGAPADAFTRCMRNIFFVSRAEPGQEGLGVRNLDYRAISPGGNFVDTDPKQLEIVPGTPQTCPRLTPLIRTGGGDRGILGLCLDVADAVIDHDVTVLAPTLNQVTVTYTAGGGPNDVFRIDPNPYAACTYGPDVLGDGWPGCNPCEGLNVFGANTRTLVLRAADGWQASSGQFQACLRRVVYGSNGPVAGGGKTVTFAAVAPNGRSSSANRVIIIRTDGDGAAANECNGLRDASIVRLPTWPPQGFYPVRYTEQCGVGCSARIAPYTTAAVGGGQTLGFAEVLFELGQEQVVGEDFVGFLPDPGRPDSSLNNPCPGLGWRALRKRVGNTIVVAGVQLFGPGSLEQYTACIRRAYYLNTRFPRERTAGPRLPALHVGIVPHANANSLQFSRLELPVVVTHTNGPCGSECAYPRQQAMDLNSVQSFAAGAEPPYSDASDSINASVPAMSAGAAGGSLLATGAHARVFWYPTPGCGLASGAPNDGGTAGGQRSVALVRTGVCNTAGDLNYMVTCAVDAESGALTGWASVAFCQAGCGFCPVRIESFADECSSNTATTAIGANGAVSFSISCQAGDLSAAQLLPREGEAYMRWVGAEGCDNQLEGATHVLVPEGVCQHNGATTGYRISCGLDGEGLYEVCDATCSSCTVSTPFRPAPDALDGLTTCMGNAANSGSASVRFGCGLSDHNVSSAVAQSSAMAVGLTPLGGMIAVAAAAAAAAGAV